MFENVLFGLAMGCRTGTYNGFYPIRCYNGVRVEDVLKIRAGLE